MDDNTIIYEFYNAKAVPVIASFSTEGKIKPLYVRLENAPIKVLSSSVIETSLHTIVFSAIVSANNAQIPIRLLYKTNENIWRCIVNNQ